MIMRVVTAMILSVVSFGSIVHADELPDNLQARGKPETRLARIDLKNIKLAGIIRRYGRPNRMKAWESDRPDFSSSYEYDWLRPRLKLHVVVERSPHGKDPNWEYVSLVEVRSGTSRQVGRTGKGLKLGDTFRDLKRIYGFRLKVRNIPKLKIHDVMIQWRQEGYSLVATLDRHNRITGLTLVAPE
jgi:hypothetical protein